MCADRGGGGGFFWNVFGSFLGSWSGHIGRRWKGGGLTNGVEARRGEALAALNCVHSRAHATIKSDLSPGSRREVTWLLQEVRRRAAGGWGEREEGAEGEIECCHGWPQFGVIIAVV